MLRLAHILRPSAPPPAPTDAGQERAERIYGLIQEAIGRADAKAATAVTLELAALGALLTLSTQGRGLPVHAVMLAVTGGLWLAAVASAGLVIFPRLAGRVSRNGTSGTYFGELRTWTPEQFTRHLTDQSAEDCLHSLAVQVVAVARIAWRKHVCLQASLVLAAAGLLVLSAGLLGGAVA